VAFLEQAVIIS